MSLDTARHRYSCGYLFHEIPGTKNLHTLTLAVSGSAGNSTSLKPSLPWYLPWLSNGTTEMKYERP